MKRQKYLLTTVTLVLVMLMLAIAAAPAMAAVIVNSEQRVVGSDTATGDSFGARTGLAVSGSVAVLGAYLDDNPVDDEGSAYIFRDDGAGWVEQVKLVASDAAPNDLFGQAVSIDGGVVVIGSFFDDDFGSHSGSAYVFRESGGIWSEEAKLLASDGEATDRFGFSVSLAGNVAVVGTPWDDHLGGVDAGSAYVYRWNGVSWVEEAKLTASDAEAGDLFGYSVSTDGAVVLIGAYQEDEQGLNAGTAYAFRWNGTTWSQEAKLLASDGLDEDSFGFAVSLSGTTALIGAYRADVKPDGSPGPGAKKDAGAAYTFLWDGTSWTEEAKLFASDVTRLGNFGLAVSIDGDVALIGSPLADNGKKQTGAAYLFQRSGSIWTEQVKLTASDGAKNDHYGDTVSIQGTTTVVGAPRDDDAGVDAGSAYFYDLSIT